MGWFSQMLGMEDDKPDRVEKTGSTPAVSRAKPAGPVAGPLAGPSWMSSEDWAKRLDVYTRQGRSDADIRQVVARLDARGPYKPRPRSEVVAWAKEQGIVSRQEFMPPEIEAEALKLGPDGLLDARLVRERDRLVVVTARGWVNPRSRTA